MLYSLKCPRHGYAYISMPRDAQTTDEQYLCKCPLAICTFGVRLGTIKAEELANEAQA